jgi:hypothetical protein
MQYNSIKLLCGCSNFYKRLVQPIRTTQGTFAICACPHPQIAYTQAILSNFELKSYSLIRKDISTIILLVNDPRIIVRLLTCKVYGHVYEFEKNEQFEKKNLFDYRAYSPLFHSNQTPVGVHDLPFIPREGVMSYPFVLDNRITKAFN